MGYPPNITKEETRCFLESDGVHGYGESRLTNKCADGVKCSEQEHQANRRTEVTIVGM